MDDAAEAELNVLANVLFVLFLPVYMAVLLVAAVVVWVTAGFEKVFLGR